MTSALDPADAPAPPPGPAFDAAGADGPRVVRDADPGSRRSPRLGAVALHYDEMDDVYRRVWSDHAHHGLWRTGRESIPEAVDALVDAVADAARIGPGSRVVDVGSGYGATGRRLARTRGATVISLTVSPRQYEFARAADAADLRLRHVLRDWLANDLPGGSADVLVAVESIGHMPLDAALAEAARVLAPGGRLVVAELLAADRVPAWQVGPLLRRMEQESHLEPLLTEEQWRQRLRAAGLEPEEIRDVTRGVRRTWPRAVRRLLALLPRDAGVRRVLFSGDYENQGFLLSILRMSIGYRLGTLRYCIITARRPG